MTQDASGEYLRNTVMTATPEQLQMMLYDAAIRFARQGREALERNDFETGCEKLLRAQRIVVELQNGLRHEVNPTLCEQLSGLYTFVYNRLIDANLNHRVGPIDEALQILEHQRETWRLLMQKLQEAAPGQEAEPKKADSGVGETLSVEG